MPFRQTGGLHEPGVARLGQEQDRDAALRAIGGLASLQRLYVHDVPLTDEGAGQFEGTFTRSDGPFPAKHQGPRPRAGGGAEPREAASRQSQRDQGRRRRPGAVFPGLAELDTLALENSKVTGAGLKELKPLERLRVLNLNGCKIAEERPERPARPRCLADALYSPLRRAGKGHRGVQGANPGLAVYR